MAEIELPTTCDGHRILHRDDGSSGPGLCSTLYSDKKGHGWLSTNNASVIDKYAKDPKYKLCEECFWGKMIIRDYE